MGFVTWKRHICEPNGSSSVLIMSLSAIIPEKSRRIKKCDKEEEAEERQNFGLFGIALKWP